MSNIYVISPNHRATGGVELLHQLVDRVNRSGGQARVVYFPFDKEHTSPTAYQAYACPQASRRDLDVPGVTVIVPETLTHLVRGFKHARVSIWWLSVDNYFGSQRARFLAANRIWPFSHWKVKPDASIRHLAQSQYAIDFLASRGVHGALALTDYLNADFIDAARHVDLSQKREVVVYNPAKGLERTQQVLDLLPPSVQKVPLKGMTRAQMVAALAGAKVYVDFGNHPGKDRIPREAAIMGCCVITNRRGSASNEVDVPIGRRYKIDDAQPGFAAVAASLVLELLRDEGPCAQDFEAYRQQIRQEQSAFNAQVERLIQSGGGV